MPDTILSRVRNESFLYSRRENRVWGYISLAIVHCSYWLSCPNHNEVPRPDLCGPIQNVLVTFDLHIMGIGELMRKSPVCAPKALVAQDNQKYNRDQMP